MEFPGEKLLIRLWETIAEKGIGGWLRPWQNRREGQSRIDVHREALLVFAQTERDIKDIQSGRKILSSDSQLLELSEQANPLAVVLDRALPRMVWASGVHSASASDNTFRCGARCASSSRTKLSVPAIAASTERVR